MKNLPKHIKIIILLFVGVLLWNLTFSASINLYNTTTELEFNYKKQIQTQVTNYDGYYLAFIDKQENANINKETFVEVTNIIMRNRKDGESLAWKWVTENQQIPYSEFTVFYKELSNFITERYKDNMYIEQTKQSIAQEHNTLLATFPNNVYNYFLGIKPIKYSFGYVSNTTLTKF